MTFIVIQKLEPEAICKWFWCTSMDYVLIKRSNRNPGEDRRICLVNLSRDSSSLHRYLPLSKQVPQLPDSEFRASNT